MSLLSTLLTCSVNHLRFLLIQTDNLRVLSILFYQIQLEMKDRNTSDFSRERREIDRKHAQFKRQLKQRRIKKWEKFRQRERGA